MAAQIVNRASAGVSEPFDEQCSDPDAYGAVLADLHQRDLTELCSEVRHQLRGEGVTFGSGAQAADFLVDPVPRIIGAPEWEALSEGLCQRVRALECFVADVYGPREIVHAGIVPWSDVASASYYEPALSGAAVPTWISIAGLDVVRDPAGTFCVLEDNLRTPSGLAYALAARRAVSARVGVPAGRRLADLDVPVGLLARALEAVAPDGVDEPRCVLLSDGPANSAFYEHRYLADRLGLALVTPAQLEVSGGRLCMRVDGRREAIDVVYRRTDADRLFAPDGRREPLAQLLLEPWRGGRLGVVNAFGTGVADDKRIHRHVEEMIRFYLGQEPRLASVVTLDLSEPAVLAGALGRLQELVVKPRDGHGGQGVVIGPQASRGELRRLHAAITAHPARYVAQELVALSRHPTVCEGELVDRHVDLRPFVVRIADEVRVLPGGLSRVALKRGSLVVNSSRDGGAKDTWILS